MTISAARLNANRRNALKSTGPITEAGKHRVRLNAWKHGFRSESGLVGPEEDEAVANRRDEWAAAFPTSPGDGYQRWLVEQLTLASVRVDRCQDHQRSQAQAEAERASSCWEVDRAADAASLGGRLAKDPDLVVSQLCRSVAGLDWLLIRWRALADLVSHDQPWDDSQRRLCLDLMRTPDEFRETDRAMLLALPPEELRELVQEHIDSLESLRDSAEALDASNRGLAEIGLPTHPGSGLPRLQRYETALWRRFRSLEASWKEARANDPDADDAEVDTDADPIGDLLTYARMIEPETDFPPGPRPKRTVARVAAPPETDRHPSPAPPTSPQTPIRSATITPFPAAEPPVMMNRRARRALKSRNRQPV